MKSRFNLILLMSMFSGALFFTACDKDDLANPDGPIEYRDASSFSYSVNPAQVGDSVMISYDALNGADCGRIHIQVSGSDGQGWGGGGAQVQPDSGVATLLFVPDGPGEYRVRAKYTRTGKKSDCDFESSGWFESTELLVVEGDTTEGDSTGIDSCETSFTADSVTCDSSSRMIVFAFVADEDLDYVKIKGNLNKGLTEDAVITVAGADFDVTQKKTGNSTHRIITLQGSVEACVPVTITITYNTTVDGSHLTSAWTATGSGVNESIEPIACE